jgi:allantoinase
MICDIAILNSKIVTPEGIYEGNIGVRNGKVICIAGKGIDIQADKKIDANGLLVLPGAVDVHYHIREPAYPEREDFLTGTKAALSGGTTTILEMPTSIPPVYNRQTFEDRKKLLFGRSYTDFGLYGGCGGTREDILSQKDAGAIGYKIFLHRPPMGKEDIMGKLCITDDDLLLEVFDSIVETGLPIAIHAEDDSILYFYMRRFRERIDPLAFCKANPPLAEIAALSKLMFFARIWGQKLKIHFVHLSTKEAVYLIRKMRGLHLDVTCETCPHYLLFTEKEMEKLGPYAKVSPPLRSSEDQLALWKALKDGTINIVASDHAPYTAKEKEEGWKNIWLAPSGLPGGELLYPIMVSKALEGLISLNKVVEVLCKNPAYRFQLYPEKGVLQVGSDADIVIVDPNIKWVVDHSKMLTKSRDSALIYDGLLIRGKVVKVILRGLEVYSDNEVIGKPQGIFLTPKITSLTQ